MVARLVAELAEDHVAPGNVRVRVDGGPAAGLGSLRRRWRPKSTVGAEESLQRAAAGSCSRSRDVTFQFRFPHPLQRGDAPTETLAKVAAEMVLSVRPTAALWAPRAMFLAET